MSGLPAEVIRVSAPVRLDFAGAWTDVAPFATEARGVVVNAAIDLRTRVSLTPGQAHYQLRSDDLDEELAIANVADMARDGKLAILKAAIRRSGIAPCAIRTSADAPPGSGLGTSGALAVALSHAIAIAQGRPVDAERTAHDAWQLETVDAAVSGGQQDQYAAAMGGFQHLVFERGATRARSIVLDHEFAQLLSEHIVVCYTGRSRFSGDTISRVMASYVAGDRTVTGALHAMADIAGAMVGALAASRLAEVGALIGANWVEQQRLAPGMCTEEMAQLEAAMTAAGSIGGKAAGAGAGGSMFFVVPGDPSVAMAAARRLGATVLPTRWADRGVGRD